MTAAVTFDLPFPNKLLWPNGRTRSYMAKHRVLKSHREWARLAALSAGVKQIAGGHGFAIAATVHPKTRNLIDRDNCVAALKSYLDGIADALGVDDRTFDTPSISFGEPIKGGLLSLTLTVNPQPQSGE